jgi:hypothetical protein
MLLTHSLSTARIFLVNRPLIPTVKAASERRWKRRVVYFEGKPPVELRREKAPGIDPKLSHLVVVILAGD